MLVSTHILALSQKQSSFKMIENSWSFSFRSPWWALWMIWRMLPEFSFETLICLCIRWIDKELSFNLDFSCFSYLSISLLASIFRVFEHIVDISLIGFQLKYFIFVADVWNTLWFITEAINGRKNSEMTGNSRKCAGYFNLKYMME